MNNQFPTCTRDSSTEETQRCIEGVMERHPKLTTNGFGFSGCISARDYEPEFCRYKADMVSDCCCEQFENAKKYLQLCQRTKAVNRAETSYGLKHEAERWAGAYISNGMFIAAAIHLGFIVSRIDRGKGDNPNAYINISSKNLPECSSYKLGQTGRC